MSIINLAFIFIFSFSISSRPAPHKKGWKYYFKKGTVQFRANMYDYSILNLIKALDRNPDLYEAAATLGDIFQIKNEKARALDYYNLSLRLNDSQPDIHCKAGLLNEFYAEYETAFNHFKKAVRYSPGHIYGNLHLVRYYIKKHESNLARKHFSISKKNGMKQSKDIFRRARSAESRHETKKATALYKQTLKKNPANIDAYERLFNIYRRQKQFRAAALIIEKLKYYKPDHENAYIYLGHVYFDNLLSSRRKYHIELAIKNFKTAIELNPENRETYYELARIYEYIRDNDSALKYRKMAEKLSD